jgi:hypothetical protein
MATVRTRRAHVAFSFVDFDSFVIFVVVFQDNPNSSSL